MKLRLTPLHLFENFLLSLRLPFAADNVMNIIMLRSSWKKDPSVTIWESITWIVECQQSVLFWMVLLNKFLSQRNQAPLNPTEVTKKPIQASPAIVGQYFKGKAMHFDIVKKLAVTQPSFRQLAFLSSVAVHTCLRLKSTSSSQLALHNNSITRKQELFYFPFSPN